jgi:hypothetical protein
VNSKIGREHNAEAVYVSIQAEIASLEALSQDEKVAKADQLAGEIEMASLELSEQEKLNQTWKTEN